MKKRTIALMLVVLMLAGMLSPLKAKAAEAPKFTGKLQNFVWNKGNTAVYNVKVDNASASDLHWYIEDSSEMIVDMNTPEGVEWLSNIGCGEACGPVPGEKRFVIDSIPMALNGFKLYCVASTAAGTAYCCCTLLVEDGPGICGPNEKWVNDPASFIPSEIIINCAKNAAGKKETISAGASIWSETDENVTYTWGYAENADDIDTGVISPLASFNQGNGWQTLRFDWDGSDPTDALSMTGWDIRFMACRVEEIRVVDGKTLHNTSCSSIVPVLYYKDAGTVLDVYSSMEFATEPTKTKYVVGEKVDLAGFEMNMHKDATSHKSSDASEFKTLPSRVDSKSTSKIFVICPEPEKGSKQGYGLIAGYNITVATPTPTPTTIPEPRFTGKLQNFVWVTNSKAVYNVSVDNASASELYWYVEDDKGVIHDLNTKEGCEWFRSLGCGNSSGPVAGKKQFVIEKMVVAIDRFKLYCVASNKNGTDYCACILRTEPWVEANPNQKWVDNPADFIPAKLVIDYHENMSTDPLKQETLSAGEHIWESTADGVIYRWFYVKNTDDIFTGDGSGLEDFNTDPGSQTIWFDWTCNNPSDPFYMEFWDYRFMACLVQEPVGTKTDGSTIYNYNHTSVVPVLYYCYHNNGLAVFDTMYFNSEPNKKTYKIGEFVDLEGFNMEFISDRISYNTSDGTQFISLPSKIESSSTKKVFLINTTADSTGKATGYSLVAGYDITVKSDDPTPTPTEEPTPTPTAEPEATPTSTPTATNTPTPEPTKAEDPIDTPVPTTDPNPTQAETTPEPTETPHEPTKAETTPNPTQPSGGNNDGKGTKKAETTKTSIIVILVILIALLSAGTGILSTIIFMKRKNMLAAGEKKDETDEEAGDNTGKSADSEKGDAPADDLPIEDLDDFRVDLDDDIETEINSETKKD